MKSLKTILFPLLFLATVNSCNKNSIEKPSELQQKYATTKAYWIPELTELLAKDSVESYPNTAVLFMGSSSIRLWKTLKEDMNPIPAIQRGYGGASYSDLIHFTEAIVKPHNVSGIVIFVANDIRAQPDDKQPEEVLALFKEVIRLIRKHHSNVPVFSVAVTPTPSRWKAWPEIARANSLIETYCSETPHLYFIKTESKFLTPEQLPDSSLFVQDMLHQNEKGYEKWGAIIKKELEEVLYNSSLNKHN